MNFKKQILTEGIKDLSAFGKIFDVGVKQKNFDFEKGLNDLIKADKDGSHIYYAGEVWKKFDYEKGLNALIKIDKKGIFIYDAGKYWKEFDYEKGLNALKNTKYYKKALKNWPRTIEMSRIISKKIKSKAKILSMKKYKIKEESMNFKKRVLDLIEAKDPDRVAGGYKAMATRLSKELNKTISPAQVKKYLASMEKKGISGKIKKGAKEATSPGKYEWGTKYKIMKAAFSK